MPGGTGSHRSTLVLVAMTLANAMILVDQTAVPLALPAAFGPTIGGLLTSVFSWRAVLMINVPLAIVAVVMARRYVAADDPAAAGSRHIDVSGTALLSISLIGVVFGLSQSQAWGWSSPGVLLPIALAVLAAFAFVWRERRATMPLVDFALLRHRNYLGASVSQFLAGMAEIGLGVIFPLLLILNLEMSPALAGLALIPTTVPMILVAPAAGRWYDRVGGRPPLVAGFICLALSGVAIALAIDAARYLALLPGLLLYGIGLSLVLTVNDPVSLDTIPPRDQGQASGVSATAEQFGGALGIAALYSIFHATYVDRLHEIIDASPLPDLTNRSGEALRSALERAQTTGLDPNTFDPAVRRYLSAARTASDHGYVVTFSAVSVIAVIAAVLVAWLVRKPPAEGAADEAVTA